MINGIHHSTIATSNLERLVSFYCDVIGFENVWQGEWGKGTERIDKMVGLQDSAARVAMLKLGNAYLEIFEYLSPRGKPNDPNRPVCDNGYTHICLNVVDIDAEYERLSRLGMQFHCAPGQSEVLRATYGRDPDGNVVELIEILAQTHPFKFGA